jgi:hypothetical protein
MTIDTQWLHQKRVQSRALDSKSWIGRWLVEMLVGLFIVFLMWQGLSVWLEMTTEITHFPEALDSIGPRPQGGFKVDTAQHLNRVQPGRSFIDNEVRYVGKDAQSTGPFVVSINPIAPNTFSVAALGDNGRCYAELMHTYGPGEEYGWTKYAKFALGVTCSGSVATLATVTARDEPQ